MDETIKKINRYINILAVTVFLCGAIAGATITVGCSSWQSGSIKAVGTIAISGDAAMRTWATYVHNGLAKTNQEAQVKFAYETYQASMNAVIDAAKAATVSTNKDIMSIVVNAAVASESSLVLLINQLTK